MKPTPIYILQDGTLAPATAHVDGGYKATVAAATAANPIVARMAFWTNDDSAKVNINTASEGTFWDTPVCNSQPGIPGYLENIYTTDTNFLLEWDLAERQGAASEYQRYPGHPATTCLSPIFGNEIAKANGWTLPQTLVGSTRALFVEEMMKIAPRVAGKNYSASPIVDYSSRGGTIRAGTDNAGKHQLQTDGTQRSVKPDQALRHHRRVDLPGASHATCGPHR